MCHWGSAGRRPQPTDAQTQLAFGLYICIAVVYLIVAWELLTANRWIS